MAEPFILHLPVEDLITAEIPYPSNILTTLNNCPIEGDPPEDGDFYFYPPFEPYLHTVMPLPTIMEYDVIKLRESLMNIISFMYFGKHKQFLNNLAITKIPLDPENLINMLSDITTYIYQEFEIKLPKC